MKIAVTAQGSDQKAMLDPRFGRTKYFVVFNDESNAYDVIDNSNVDQVAHGAGPLAVQMIADAAIDVVITGNGPGGNAARGLQTAGIQVYLCKEEKTVEEAIEAFKKGELTKF